MEAMLRFDQVTKRYGRHHALKAISFTAGPGEVIALLGRNGAGKSTLMNLLTGYIAPTEGHVLVGGFDAGSSPLEARRLVGYLPEQPPLYPDMTVTEYLGYCAALKGMPRKARRQEVERVIQRAGLSAYARRLSCQLSKGYRQRLGVAQALLGAPALLVLDEPGSGLDPLQMTQMRDVIHQAGQESTVLLSSHILSEVTSVCSRAIVLDQGEIRYDGSMQALLDSAHCLRVRLRGGAEMLPLLEQLPGVLSLRAVPCNEPGCIEVELTHEAQADIRSGVAQACAGALLELCPVSGGLEQAFLRLIQEKEEG